MAVRSLTRVLLKVVSGNYQPDTGQTVTIVDANNVSTTLLTLAEVGTSGNYVVQNFTTTPKFGYFKIGATVKYEWGKIWLGADAQLRAMYIFKKVEVFDSGDTPTGAKGASRTFTSGTSPLNSDSEGNAPPSFTNVPLVLVDGSPYQERYCFKANDPSLSGGNVTFQTAVADVGDNHSDGKCYADIIIISLD